MTRVEFFAKKPINIFKSYSKNSKPRFVFTTITTCVNLTLSLMKHLKKKQKKHLNNQEDEIILPHYSRFLISKYSPKIALQGLQGKGRGQLFPKFAWPLTIPRFFL